jgi:hypothetical protein
VHFGAHKGPGIASDGQCCPRFGAKRRQEPDQIAMHVAIVYEQVGIG